MRGCGGCARVCRVAMILKKKARKPTPLMSQSAGRAHTCAGQTTLDAQDTGALLSLVSLALCFLHRLCHTSQTDVLTLCANVLLSFSLLPPSVFIRDGWCPHTLHTSPLVTTMQTVAAGSSHVCASEPARRTHTHTLRSRIVRLSRSLFVVPLQSLTITPIPESPKRKSTLRAHLHSVQIGDRRAPQRIIMAARSHHPSRALPLSRLTGAIASRDDHHHHFRALAAQTRPPERTAAAGCPPSRPSPKSRRACRQGCC